MKKYLMTGIAALALCVGFTSCSHDVEQLSQEEITELKAQQVVLDYQKAFVATFGQPAANHKWGFVDYSQTRTRAKSDYAGAKGTMQPMEWYQDTEDGWKWKTRPYVFPSAPESFPTTYAEGATYYASINQDFTGGNIWIDENNTGSINVRGIVNLYIVKSGTGEGNVTIAPTSWYVGNVPYGSTEKTRVYVCPGVDFVIPADAWGNLQANVEYYFAPGSSLTINQTLKLNGTCFYMANNTTTTATNLEVNNNGLFYNMGTANITSEVSVQNANSVIVNDGTLNAASLKTQGSGKFQNNAEVTISGKTIVNSNYNTWVNNGFYHTDDFEFTATSSNVINNCKLLVDDSFFMNCSDGSSIFQMEGGATSGASVVTTYFYGGGVYGGFNGGPYRIEMGSKSLFKVTETAYLNATASGTVSNGYGFFGVGSDYAVFQAKNITNAGNPGHGYVAYGGKLYVSAESHFAQGTAGAADGCSYICFFDGDNNQAFIYAPGFEEGLPNIQIAETTCNPGFNNTPSEWDLRIIAEDLNATAAEGDTEDSDWDFNDVVLDVKFLGDDNVRIRVTAAGATLPIRINGEDALEVHGLYGKPTNIMINTGAAAAGYPAQAYENKYPAAATFERNISGVDASYGANIKIEVQKNVNGEDKWLELTAKAGEPAAKMGVLPDYTYCPERTDIRTMYSGFVAWVTKQNTVYWWRQ